MNKDRDGIPIGGIDPKPEIRKYAENARDWEYSLEAQFQYGMAVLFKDRLLDPILLTDRGRLPDPIISFEDLRNRKILAGYTLHRNPQGLLDEITFKTVHYREGEIGNKEWKYGRWAQLETLLHEQVHLWQQDFGEDPVKPGKVYHNKEFVAKCESLGLHPLPVVGCHMQVTDGVFSQLMQELGIPRPSDIPKEQGEKSLKRDWFRPERERGRSTLTKYTCGCGEHIRVGKKDWPGAICKACGTEYVKDDGLTHTLFSVDDTSEESKNPWNSLVAFLSSSSHRLTMSPFGESPVPSRPIQYPAPSAPRWLSLIKGKPGILGRYQACFTLCLWGHLTPWAESPHTNPG